MGRPRIPSESKFWSLVEKTDGCWKWLGSFDKDGYPNFWDGDNQKMMRGHQYSAELHLGDRKGMCVLHKCDNPSCVNPDHLFFGTHSENQHDKVSKNRHAKGESQGHHKLTEKQVSEIRHRRSDSYKIICKEFDLAPSTVYRIWHSQSWSHI